ncbi:MAG: hypothetical protein J6386_10405 [Candidatus Synoicihabitans palmerolidicus]|nr:hypothetical protein [Candidatus Synoicihabitans palmerolidicus]
MWNATVFYRAENWEFQVNATNLTNERYFSPYDAFAANAIILKGEELNLNASFTHKF